MCDLESDLVTLHEDLLEENEDGAREILGDFRDDALALRELCTRQVRLPGADPEWGMTALHRAAAVGNTSVLRTLLAHLPAEAETDDVLNVRVTCNALTPLHLAAAEGHTAMASFLAANGAKVNNVDCAGRTPLHLSAEHGHEDVARILVVKGASVHVTDAKGQTPLHLASRRGHVKMVQFLLKREAAVNTQDEAGATPLHAAQIGRRGRRDVTEALVAHGAATTAQDLQGNTPLHRAIANLLGGSDETLINGSQCNGVHVKSPSDGDAPPLPDFTWQILLNSKLPGVNLQNQQENTPLHLAASTKNVELVTELLEKGAEPGTTNKEGQTPLFFCREARVAKLLLQKNGPSLVKHTDRSGSTCLHVFCSKPELSFDLVQMTLASGAPRDLQNDTGVTAAMLSSAAGDLEKVEFLLDQGANKTLADAKGKNLLHFAVQSRNLDLVRFLVSESHMDVNVVDKMGLCPLHLASSNGDLDIAEFLVSCKAKVNVNDVHGKLPTAYAIKSGNVQLLDCLLSHGAIVADTSQGSTSPLHLFSIRGDMINVRKLVDQGFDLQKLDENDRSALHCSLLAQHFDVSHFLLSRGAKAGTVDTHHSSPLHTAAMYCTFPDLFHKLVSSGAAINLRNALRQNALHLCVLHNTSVEVLRTILDLGADPNLEDSRGFVPLQHVIRRFTKRAAAESTNLEPAELVDWVLAFFEVEGQVDVNCSDSEGKTCVHYTAENGQARLLQIMLDNGGHPDIQDKLDRTPLHNACEKNHSKCVSLLLKYGSSIDVFDSFGCTPLIYAVKCGSNNCVEQLLGKGADIELTKGGSLAPLLLALAARHVEIAEVLLMNDCDVSVCDSAGKTALHYAAQYTTHSIVQTILASGSDVNVRDSQQMTSLHMAAQNPDAHVLKVLLSHGASVNAQDRWGNTALHLCAESGSYSHVELLVAHGANIELANSRSQTPLHSAVRAQETDVLELLIANEANVNAVDANYQTPLILALSSGNCEAASILLDQGCDVSVLDSSGQSALHKVARLHSARPSVVQSLIMKGLNPIAKDASGHSAIDLADGPTAALLMTLQAEKMTL